MILRLDLCLILLFSSNVFAAANNPLSIWRMRWAAIQIDDGNVALGRALRLKKTSDQDVDYLISAYRASQAVDADRIRFSEADDLLKKYSEQPGFNPKEGLSKLSAALVNDFDVVNKPFFYSAERVFSSALRVRYGVEAALLVANAPISNRLSSDEQRLLNRNAQYGRSDFQSTVIAIHLAFLGIIGGTIFGVTKMDSDILEILALFGGTTAAVIAVNQISNPKIMSQWIDAAAYSLWKNPMIKDFIDEVGKKAPLTVIPKSSSQARWFFNSYARSLSYLLMTDSELAQACQKLLK